MLSSPFRVVQKQTVRELRAPRKGSYPTIPDIVWTTHLRAAGNPVRRRGRVHRQHSCWTASGHVPAEKGPAVFVVGPTHDSILNARSADPTQFFIHSSLANLVAMVTSDCRGSRRRREPHQRRQDRRGKNSSVTQRARGFCGGQSRPSGDPSYNAQEDPWRRASRPSPRLGGTTCGC